MTSRGATALQATLTPQAHGAGLAPLLCPASVAVVGAGRTGTGHDILESLCSGGFTGRLYAVERGGCLVCGLLARPSLLDLPEPVDLIVVAVPPARVRGVLADAARAGARAAVIVTPEDGPETVDPSGEGPTQWPTPAELDRFAHDAGMRVIGPGSGGVLNMDPAVRLDATYSAALPVRGGLAVVSQAGAEGTLLLEELHGAGLAVHSWVSLGRTGDVTAADLVRVWAEDDAVDAIAVVLGGLQHRPAVWSAAQSAARRKPVLTFCTPGPGQAPPGPAGAGPAADLLAEALRNAGVVDVRSLDDLLDAARLLSGQPRPAGPRLGVVGNVHELDRLVVTAAREWGLTLPDGHGLPNPWELPLVADPIRFADAVSLRLEGGHVDQLLVVVAPNRDGDLPGLLWTVARELDRHPDVPAAIVVPGHGGRTLGTRRVPVFDSAGAATRALGRATAYALRGRGLVRDTATTEDPGEGGPVRRHWQLQLGPVDRAAARRVVDGAAEGRQPVGVTEALLRAYGLPVAPSAPAGSEDEAVAAAAARYPVAVKAADPRLVDKSAADAVVLGVCDPHEVRAAYRYLTGGVDGHAAGVLVQPMLDCRSELVVDVARRDDGTAMTLSLVDCRREPAVRELHCQVPDGAGAALAAGRRLLDGSPRRCRADETALAELLGRVGELVREVPEIRELSLDPVLLHPAGLIAVDARLWLEPH